MENIITVINEDLVDCAEEKDRSSLRLDLELKQLAKIIGCGFNVISKEFKGKELREIDEINHLSLYCYVSKYAIYRTGQAKKGEIDIVPENIVNKMIVMVNHHRPHPTHIFLSKDDHIELMLKSMSRDGLGSLDYGWDDDKQRFTFTGAMICSCDGPSHCANIGDVGGVKC